MHSFRINSNFEGKTILEVNIILTKNGYENRIKKLEELKSPSILIEGTKTNYQKFIEKVKNNKFTPQYTYRDGLDKTLLNTVITEYKEEYNRNDKLVAIIINNMFKINIDTKYCPIITRI